MIAIIDYKAGNIASLVAALKRLGQDCVVTNDPAVIRAADKVIFPGQGRAKPAMAELKRTGLDHVIPTLTQPFLGICLGMQLLLERSEEDTTKCLGIIPGRVKRFQTKQPVPQMGWNNGYYFVHSYYVDTAARYTLYRHCYGSQWFASMIGKDHFYGTQFHPEKSGALGLQLLKQFCAQGQIAPTQVIPALDLLEGKCVRLQQGDYQQVTEYSADPLATALTFQKQGAVWLHVVDLDGAKAGQPLQQAVILDLVKNTQLRLEVGGGIRNIETARQYLESGVDRIILGTAAIEQPELIGQLIEHYGADRIVVGLDIKNNDVATDGWTATSGVDVMTTLKQFKDFGVRQLVITDISKDGMLTGPNFSLCQTVQQQGFNVTISGGVSSNQDIEQAKQLGFSGVIVGKALYEGKVTLKPQGFSKRIIACLDIANGRVVKGRHFTNLKDQGDPVELAKRYAEQGADEIVLLDIMATVEHRDTLYQLVTRVAETLSIPFTVGGGIQSIADIRALLRAGADKVSIGSAAVYDPQFVQQATQEFGAQCIVISIDARRSGSSWEIYVKGGREATGVDAVQFAQQMEQAGAGELLVNSLDRDGTNQGYDLALLQAIKQTVSIPVIASSGAGSIAHLLAVVQQANVDAVLAAGIFHRNEITIPQVKKLFQINHIPTRLCS